METLRIAMFQPDIFWKNAGSNKKMFDDLFSKIRGQADVFVLPEMFTTGFVPDPSSVAEAPDGSTFQWMKQCAVTNGCAIAGSVVFFENGKYYNRLIWMNPDGTHFTYDKRHLFSLGNENAEYSQGEKNIVIDYEGWKIRPLICYDLRFPVWARNKFSEGTYEYDILLFSANWPASRRFHWRQLLMARAIENQCYAIGVNRRGRDGNGWHYAGGSTLATPDGRWDPESEDADSDVIIVELNKTALEQYRKTFPFAQDWDKFELI